PKKTRNNVSIVLYEKFEKLELFGPDETRRNVSEMYLIKKKKKTGPILSAQGVATVATHAFGDVSAVDILMIPGGRGTVHQLSNSSLLDFVRRLHRETELTTSVCTGSAILAKAGILDGRRATSNKTFFALAESQSDQVTWVRHARWVEDGKLFTSAGVSAGTDMALAVVARLFGQVRAEVLARQLEYHWHPDSQFDPFSEPIVETANQTD
ncbi:MAG: DJ-1/PfpI family protein, partial [Planctomycetales bacterium]|nr:DJ-1/PfpI family protein [Planctomycetales bacterium]